MKSNNNLRCLSVSTIKKITILLIISGSLVLGMNSGAHAFGPIITEADSDRALATYLTSEQSHANDNFVNYLNIGSKNLNLQSDKISNQIVGNANLATTATTAEGIFPLGESGVELSSYIGAGVIQGTDGSYGANFTDNGVISTAGMGMHFQPNKESNIRFSLAWDHYDIDLNEMYDIPATTDSVNITSIGVTFDF
jgi:hypothetical protein